jgi:acyl-CoA synthetase (NDP forming)
VKGFFYPESVAVIGVSASPNNLARAIAYHLVEFRYTGRVYLVGHRGGAFMSHKIYRSVEDIPDTVDLAAILTPATTLPEIIEACGQKGIRRLVIESAGFSELGRERLSLENTVVESARKYGIRFIGPNCIGVINKENGLALPFMPFRNTFQPGSLSIISQSGGVGGALLNALAGEHLGFNKFASIGNKLNTDENDLLEYLLEDEGTRTIFLYLEGIANGRRLMEIACRSSKPILVHKSNTTEASARIARSHTASLSASEEIVNAAFRQCGIKRVTDMRTAMDLIRACNLPPMRGNRLAVVSRSGGHAVVSADAAAKYGFVLQPFPEDFLRFVEKRLRAGVIRLGNPMDLGDLFDLDLFRQIVSDTLQRDDIDGILVVHNYNAIFFEEESRSLVKAVKELSQHGQKPVALCVVTSEEELRWNRRNHPGFPLFTEPEEAARALAFSRDFSMHRRHVLEETVFFSRERDRAAAIMSAAENRRARQLTTAEAFQVLSCYGIASAPWAVGFNARDAWSCARGMAAPVAMKVMGETFVHKTDAGGVLLNLTSEREVRAAYKRLATLIRETEPGSTKPAILIQKMIPNGQEVFVGGRQDQNFGPVVLFGLGGIYVEILGDVSLRVAPVIEAEARKMLAEIRGARILGGVRGQPVADRNALVQVIQRVSQLLVDFPQIEEMDINPIKVLHQGQGCLAVDCRMVLVSETLRTEQS